MESGSGTPAAHLPTVLVQHREARGNDDKSSGCKPVVLMAVPLLTYRLGLDHFVFWSSASTVCMKFIEDKDDSEIMSEVF